MELWNASICVANLFKSMYQMREEESVAAKREEHRGWDSWSGQ